ncbi:MAG: hypothetical protein E7035_09025 [Verrucomicrobiaceae bacterium]|nr:hypothetical protein [Verrucomicrobiaceae bacterium]
MKISDPVFDSLSYFLISPSILLGIFIILGIYSYVRWNFGSVAANVALPLIIIIIFYYNLAILITLTTPDLGFKYSQLIGAIYSIVLLTLMIKGASKQKKLGKLVGTILEKSNGMANGLEVEIFNLPLRKYKTNGRKILYENQSYELLQFLEEKITDKVFNEITQKGCLEIKVETESVSPYTLKITISDKYKDEDSEAFLSDVLDAIADLYNRNKIKV